MLKMIKQNIDVSKSHRQLRSFIKLATRPH